MTYVFKRFVLLIIKRAPKCLMTSKMCIGCGLCRIIEKLEIWERTWACEWPSCICVTSCACVYALHMRTVYLFTYSDRPQRKVILKFRGWVLSCLEKKFQKCRSIEILSRYFFLYTFHDFSCLDFMNEWIMWLERVFLGFSE